MEEVYVVHCPELGKVVMVFKDRKEAEDFAKELEKKDREMFLGYKYEVIARYVH